VEPERVETAFDGAIFTVERLRLPGTERPYEVVRHPGAAAVLPITPDGHVILVEQLRPAIGQTLVEIPAGLLDRPDEDALACATRELLEETGYRHVSIRSLGGIFTTAGFSDEYVHLFLADTEPDPVAEPEDGIALVRRPFGDMVSAARAGRVRDAKTALALLLADARRSRA
jgi:ADP-ribose pyrophosphatase